MCKVFQLNLAGTNRIKQIVEMENCNFIIELKFLWELGMKESIWRTVQMARAYDFPHYTFWITTIQFLFCEPFCYALTTVDSLRVILSHFSFLPPWLKRIQNAEKSSIECSLTKAAFLLLWFLKKSSLSRNFSCFPTTVRCKTE